MVQDKLAVESLVLAAGEMGVSVSAEQATTLLSFLALLQQWNKTYNLTAVTDWQDMLQLHLLDSLSVVPYLTQQFHQAEMPSLLDIGSGGGLPGIPIAILCPWLQITLVDKVNKKTAFLQHAKGLLGLKNVQVKTGRAEQVVPQGSFDAAICRAFADLPLFVSIASPLVKTGGQLLAMKGLLPESEVVQISKEWQVQIHPLVVHGLTAERHLLILEECQHD
jgi:16S rRNA (guanine527-N7)-methyltransferase